MSRFVLVDRDTAYLLPPSVQEWLPEGHLARYVVDVVEASGVADCAGERAADAGERPAGMDMPQELARRSERLARLAEAKAQIEAAAAREHEQAQAQFEAKQAERERRKDAGRRPPGAAPGAAQCGG